MLDQSRRTVEHAANHVAAYCHQFGTGCDFNDDLFRADDLSHWGFFGQAMGTQQLPPGQVLTSNRALLTLACHRHRFGNKTYSYRLS